MADQGLAALPADVRSIALMLNAATIRGNQPAAEERLRQRLKDACAAHGIKHETIAFDPAGREPGAGGGVREEGHPQGSVLRWARRQKSSAGRSATGRKCPRTSPPA